MGIKRVTKAPCETNGDDEHNNTCPFCGALPMARCRYDETAMPLDAVEAKIASRFGYLSSSID
jgi:hypothetical protein